ncbi:hypothetical protein XMIN_3528 [Xanthomonas citri pv. mangiferaeindicae LMG 941]|nr:hypothetical protein XMIN_3528 [Xanthomonas citri pv. mangiferaeindicae LMG 941]
MACAWCADSGGAICWCQPPTANRQPPTANRQPPIPNPESRIPNPESRLNRRSATLASP